MINLTDENAKKREWQRQLRLQISLENKFAKDVQRILKKQYLESARLAEGYNWDVDYAVDLYKEEMIETFRTNYRQIATTMSDDTLKEFEKSYVTFEQKGLIEEFWQFMNIWILANSASQVVKVSNTTKKILRTIISNSINDGDTNRETSKKIKEVSEISTITRARTIARTETHTAGMKSLNETMKASRQVLMKEWFSANDSRVRVKNFNHLKAHGERVMLDGYFMMTGEALEYPGDFIGSAGNVINCRCAVLHHTNIM